MKHWYVSWNEHVSYESEFYTDEKQGSPEWWNMLFERQECLGSDGMDNTEIELCDDDN